MKNIIVHSIQRGLQSVIKLSVAIVASTLIIAPNAFAQTLEIVIDGGVSGGTPIAVVPFDGSAGLPQNVSDVISGDLQRSGRFDVLPKSGLVARPTVAQEVNVNDWRLLKQDWVVIGQINANAGMYAIDYSLFDVVNGRVVDSATINSTEAQLRSVAHKISDRIYEKITGIPGAFNTKIAYVLTKGQYQNKTYELQVADADGYGQFAVLKSSKPIISPAWSPDGQQLAYTLIENAQHKIYLHNIYTGSRSVLAQYKGINTSPAFSPDGRKMAFTSSKDGNAEIYVMDLTSKSISRLTNNRNIDTEPTWSGDGRFIIFTSDRSGRPQLYRMSAFGGADERLTFQGKENAKGEVNPRTGTIALVTNQGNGGQIGLLQGGNIKVLSPGRLDDSPSYSPNGEMILFAGKRGSTGILSVVSELGRQSHELKFQGGDVKDPAWSPVLN